MEQSGLDANFYTNDHGRLNVSQTEQSSQGGGRRSIIYIIIAVLVLAIIYYASAAYWSKEQARFEAPASKETAPAAET